MAKENIKKRILDEAFGRAPESFTRATKDALPPIVSKVDTSPQELRDKLMALKADERLPSSAIKGLAPEELIKSIKEKKLLSAMDLSDGQAIVYPNKKVQDLRWHGGGSGGGSGTVTSVDGSGGTTGMTLTGGPITTAGTLTLGGTLNISNGGTSATTKTIAFDNLSPLTTKGDIITFDGTNNVRLGVGADGQTIIADASQTDGIKWGLPNDFYDAFVGTSLGDYATLGAAIADGKKAICVEGNTTETGDIDLISTVFIWIKYGATVDMGPYQFTDVGGFHYITIFGQGVLKWTYVSGAKQLFNLDNKAPVRIDGITLTNTSTVADSYIGDKLYANISNVTFNLPNADNGGLVTTTENCRYSNILFNGGGSACTLALDISGNNPNVASNILLNGTFKTSSATSNDSIVRLSSEGSLTNLTFLSVTNPIRIEVDAGSQLTNCQADLGNAHIDLYVGSNVGITNASLSDGSMVLMAGANESSISNVDCLLFDASSASTNSCNFSDIFVDSAATAVTVGGERHKFTNCIAEKGFILPSGANDNGFVNCQAGASGGSSATITVQAGSNRTRIVGCMTDVAISDAGTGTVTAANTVY